MYVQSQIGSGSYCILHATQSKNYVGPKFGIWKKSSKIVGTYIEIQMRLYKSFGSKKVWQNMKMDMTPAVVAVFSSL